jgi:excisionase family DNA binding protein
MVVLDECKMVLDELQYPTHIPSMSAEYHSENMGKAGGLLRLKAAAARLGVSVRTLYRAVAQGELTLIHIRGCARIAEEDLQNYIERSTQRRKA